MAEAADSGVAPNAPGSGVAHTAGQAGGSRRAWMAHVKKTMAAMKKPGRKVSLKMALKAAKKTYKKSAKKSAKKTRRSGRKH